MLNWKLAIILSEDLSKAPFYRHIILDNVNAVIAHNNDFYQALSNLIGNQEKINYLKQSVFMTSKFIEEKIGKENPVTQLLKNIYAIGLTTPQAI